MKHIFVTYKSSCVEENIDNIQWHASVSGGVEENAPGAGPGTYSGGGYGKVYYFLASRQYHPPRTYFICNQLNR